MHRSRLVRAVAAVAVVVLALVGLVATPAQAAGFTISGQVMLTSTGAAAGAGEVEVRLMRSSSLIATTTTQASGAFTLTDVPANTNYKILYVSLRADSMSVYTGGWGEFESNSVTAFTLNSNRTEPAITLPESGEVSGRVSLGEAGNYAGAGEVQIDYWNCRGGNTCSSTPATLNTTFTDADGEYELTDLAGGTWRFALRHLDGEYLRSNAMISTNVTVKPSARVHVNKDFLLAHAGVVQGHVSLADGRTPGAGEIEISDISNSTTPHVLGYTDASGNYRFAELAPGSHNLRFKNLGQFSYQLTTAYVFFDASGWAYTRDVTMPVQARVTGTIRDSAGQPVAEGLARLESQSTFSYYDGDIQPDGTFNIVNVPAGRYRLRVMFDSGSQHGWRYWTPYVGGNYGSEFFELTATEVRSGMDITVYDWRTQVDGLVECGGCTIPVTTVRLELRIPGQQRWRQVDSYQLSGGPFGGYQFYRLIPGEYRAFVAGVEGWDSKYSQPFTVAEGVTTAAPTITLSRADLLVRMADGRAYRYPSASNGGLGTPSLVGSLAQYNRMVDAGDINGDGLRDLVVTVASGTLSVMYGKPDGTYQKAISVSSGWRSFNVLTAAGDLNLDGRPDLVARHTSGALYFVAGQANGRFAAPRLVGSAVLWRGYSQIAGVGDVDGDGAGDLIVRTSAGVGSIVFGDGVGGFRTATSRFTTRWTNVVAFVGVGTYGPDAYPDLVALMTNGDLILISTDPFWPFTGTRIGAGYRGRVLI